jgi:hypothetical protein
MTRRLRHMIVSSAGEAADAIGVSRSSAQHDHRQVGIDPGREPVEQRQAAAVVEDQVQHHERGLAHLDRPQALPRPARPGDGEAVRGQVVEQEGARQLIVLHDQDQALLVHTREKECGGESRPGVGVPAWTSLPYRRILRL